MTGNETRDVATPNYTMGYDDEFQALLSRRSAALNAEHLLPRLKSGLRVLDFGCGPGTISMGLADAVAPGELHGIDMEETQIEMAKAAASAGGHSNAIFRTGDVTDLPYEDDFFDVAHCHAVLMHVPGTAETLAEVKRVLKPGGIISARELIGDSMFFEPGGDMDGALEVFKQLLAANGAHPQMGKELKRVFHEAGFSDIEPSASFECYGSTEDVTFYHGFASGWFFTPEIIGAATKYGLATQEQFDGWRATIDEWRDSPGAFATIAWGEAIARKP